MPFSEILVYQSTTRTPYKSWPER